MRTFHNYSSKICVALKSTEDQFQTNWVNHMDVLPPPISAFMDYRSVSYHEAYFPLAL
jgi:hypothetical protein